jgi:hypothetical protein
MRISKAVRAEATEGLGLRGDTWDTIDTRLGLQLVSACRVGGFAGGNDFVKRIPAR